MSLSPEARSSITRAVEAAESVCGAEVVVVGYVRADGYLDTAFRNGLVGALLALALVLMLPIEVHHDLVFPIVVVTAVGLFWLTRLTAVARLTTLAARKAMAVDAATAQAFLARGVHKTRERVGMMIVWFDLEETVRVVFDTGLEARVPKDVRARLTHDLVAACGSADRRAGAIAAVGAVLAPFVPRGDDDVDELDNAPTAGRSGLVGGAP